MKKRALITSFLTVMMIFSSVFAGSLCADTVDGNITAEQVTHIYNVQRTFTPDKGIGGFVARLYKIALQRDYEEKGFLEWCNKLADGSIDGANVARGFFFSEEFLNKNYTVDEYLTILYRVFFDREPDTDGFNAWKKVIMTGRSYESVLEDFIDSTEWANVCMSYGILSGGRGIPNKAPQVSDEIGMFVTSLYKDVLGRSPDPEGFKGWCESLASQKITGKEAARGFFYSSEFKTKFASLSNTDKVTLFYKVFLNREPDEAGLSSWVKALENGGNIDTLFNGFSDSEEFKSKCISYGIIADKTVFDKMKPSDETFLYQMDGVYYMIRGHFDENAENKTLVLVNELRSSLGAGTVILNEEAREAARLRAIEIYIDFSHQSPNGSSVTDTLDYRYFAENICKVPSYKENSFFEAWRNSNVHYHNMINSNYTSLGVGVFVPRNSSDGFGYGVEIFIG